MERAGYDLGLIVPLREEFDQAREILDFEPPIIEGGDFLFPFTVPGSGLTGMALVLHQMGLAGAAAATARLLARYDFGLLALIGIAGALSSYLQLGDVIIASAIDEYLVAARASDGSGFEFEVGGTSWAASRDILNYANSFRYLPGGYEPWARRAKARRDPGLDAFVGKVTKEAPDYSVGLIASGDVVGAAVPFADWLRQHNRGRAALEMEAGGAARAVYQRGETNLIVIRGISDFADERKKDLDGTAGSTAPRGAWRRYAALNAFDLLAALVVQPEFPWPGRRAGS